MERDPQVAIMKSYMTGGITDISPVIDSYTDALLDVYPQVTQPLAVSDFTRSLGGLYHLGLW